MKLKFPYQVRTSPIFGQVPTIKLRLPLKTIEGIEVFTFLFDTGADVTSMPISAAEKLGIDIKKCKKILMSGFEGSTITVHLSKISLVLDGKSFTIPCVFNPNINVALLLGRAGILNKFTITMDAKKKVAIFQEI